jgi:hypothetical protein
MNIQKEKIKRNLVFIVVFILGIYIFYSIFIYIPKDIKDESNNKCINSNKGEVERIDKFTKYKIYCSNGNLNNYRNSNFKKEFLESFLSAVAGVGVSPDFEIEITSNNIGVFRW